MQSWIIGSSSDSDIVVDLPAVSGRHCRLSQVSNGFLLEDLGSTNGTFVNGVRIGTHTRISPTDTVTLGAITPMPWPGATRDAGSDVIRIGRDPDNDVVVDDASVSGHHARIVRSQGRATIEDLGSTNGTYLGSLDRPIVRALLSEADTIILGSCSIPASRFLKGMATPTPIAAPGSIRFRGRALVLGRDPECEEVIDLPTVSGRHARLFRSGCRILIEDLNSSNGTYVNGERVRRPVEVVAGDTIGLGSWSTTLVPDIPIERDRRGHGARIEARSVDAIGRGRGGIAGVSLTIEPSEFVGVVGIHGADGSALLDVLSGVARPAGGSVRIDGREPGSVGSGALGLVPREGSVHRELPAHAAVEFAALLRLPPGLGAEEAREKIRSSLARVGLPVTGGQAGGDRHRRVEVAVELLGTPPAPFLDCPNEGLSPADEQAFLEVLREVADDGTTVVASFDRLRVGLLPLMDNLAVLAGDGGSETPGRLIYYGPAFPEAVESLRLDPRSGEGAGAGAEEIVRWTFGDRRAGQAASDFAGSPIYQKFVTRRAEGSAGPENTVSDRDAARVPWVRQWWALTRRDLAVRTRRIAATAVVLAQGPAFAVLLILAFGRRVADRVVVENWDDVARGVESVTFAMGLAALWIGASSSIGDLAAERTIYLRERSIGLKPSAYLASKLAVLGALACVECLAMLAIVHRGVGLKGDWPTMFGLLVLASAVGVGLGMIVSATARSARLAIAVLPAVFVVLIALGGGLGAPGEANAAVRMAAQAMPTRWAFEGLLGAESKARPTQLPPSSMAGDLPEARDMAERSFPFDRDRMGPRACGTALGAMFLGLVGWVWVILAPGGRRRV